MALPTRSSAAAGQPQTSSSTAMGVPVRAPEWADDDQVANIVESKHYWIYQGLAEWRDLNSTRVLREYKNGEGFLYSAAPIGSYS